MFNRIKNHRKAKRLQKSIKAVQQYCDSHECENCAINCSSCNDCPSAWNADYVAFRYGNELRYVGK